MEKQNIGLTEGIIIATVPVIGYWIAFLFEFGYCNYFNIPSTFVEIGIQNIMIAIIGLLGLLAIIFNFANFFFMSFKWLPKTIKASLQRIFLASAFTYGFFLFNKHPISQVILITSIMFIFLIFIEFVFPLIRQTKTKGYLEKLKAQDKFDFEEHTLLDVAAIKIGYNKFLLIYLVFILSFLAYFAGSYNAKYQINFLVLNNEKELVVLKTYSKFFLAAKFDRKTKTIFTEYKLIPVDTQLGIFKFEQIGPLLPKRF